MRQSGSGPSRSSNSSHRAPDLVGPDGGQSQKAQRKFGGRPASLGFAIDQQLPQLVQVRQRGLRFGPGLGRDRKSQICAGSTATMLKAIP
jgi:hypothetical protein